MSLPTLPSLPTPTPSPLDTALHVITTERDALSHLEHLYRTNDLAQKNMSRAVAELVRTIRRGGKLVVCGVGKSGKIGRKLEATMNSVGIHSVFLHPTEALHGDLGVIRSVDTLLLISFSGRTAELLLMLPHIPPTVPIIAITAHLHPSTCPLLSFNNSSPDMTILLPAPLHIDEESSFGLSAPTSSTTVALALGDALALATAQNLHTLPGQGPSEVFKGYHPGGAIGADAAAAAAASTSTISTVSTPATSMTTSPSLSSLEDALPTKLTLDDDDYAEEEEEDPSKIAAVESICSSAHFVAVDYIPTVTASLPSPSSPSSSLSAAAAEANNQIRILDLLLTAIQNPASKSWVKLSATQIVPPSLLRYITKPSSPAATAAAIYNIDTPLSDISSISTTTTTTTTTTPTFIPSTEWVRVLASSTLDEIRCILDDHKQRRQDENRKYVVISVVDDHDTDKILGFVSAEDIYP